MRNYDYQPIENYGVIGNLNTVALVSLAGSIDFMSFPDFDSPAVFASILDAKKGGRFVIEPQMNNPKRKQLYLLDTAILLTRFLSENGITEITDYMPIVSKNNPCTIIRKVTNIRGTIRYNMLCSPRFNFGQSQHHVTIKNNELIFTPEEPQPAFRLLSNIQLSHHHGDAIVEFELKEAETAYFLFEMMGEETNNHLSSIPRYVEKIYSDTINYWRNWVSASQYKGRWIEMVNRSAITLKLLTSSKYGSVIAAATCSLPEKIGGIRNWDYRYTWIRDASFTMNALLELGFKEEASKLFAWLEKQCLEKPLHLIYKVDGHAEIPESELTYLEGYRKSKPVRVGNDAQKQFQLDIFGELIDTIYLFNKKGGTITYEFWNIITRMIEKVINQWQEPDHSIWEIRGEQREFLYSRLMCWVAMDRAIKIAEDLSYPYPVNQWQAIRDAIFNDIHKNFWDNKKQAFIQSKGSSYLDASILLMPIKGIISPSEKSWLSTMAAIDKELRQDVLVFRYKSSIKNIDGVNEDEGTFTMCSFWFIECLAKSGYIEKAVESFEKMLGYANHLGLYAEQLGMKGEHLGNFPQAFTHLALIRTVLELEKNIN